MKKIGIFLCLLLIFFVSGCQESTEDTDPKTPPVKVELEKIQVMDKDGEELSTISLYQAAVETEYNHEGVFVWAFYSNETHKDVTKDAKFSEVDLTKPGLVKVTVSYEDKKAEYNLDILENKVKTLTLGTLNCKRLFEKDSLFDSAGLVVKAEFSDGTFKPITEYNLSLIYNGTPWQSLATPLTSLGSYRVRVTAGTAQEEYEILVYEPLSSSHFGLKIDSLVANLTLDDSGKYSYKTAETIFESDSVTVQASGVSLHTKDAQGNDIHHVYNTKEYNAYMMIPTSYGLEITLTETTEVFIVAGNQYGSKIDLQGASGTYTMFGNINNYTSVLYAKLEPGTYQLISSSSTTVLYEIEFSTKSVL